MIQTAIVKTSAAILIFAGFISFAQHSHSPASFYQELSWPAITRRCRLRNEPRVVSRSEPRNDTHFGGGLGGAICRTATSAPLAVCLATNNWCGLWGIPARLQASQSLRSNGINRLSS
jgi:hypothetical protein